MTRDEIMALATARGLTVRPCHSEDCIMVQTDQVALDRSERMRFTASGGLLMVDDGYYWQVGTHADLAQLLKEPTK